MVAQEWVGHRMISSVYFEPDEQGLDLFASYLGSLRGEPVKLLVDLIEEEFRKVTIPVTRGNDRKEMVNRNFAKFFRNSDYKFAISQLVEKKDRKEEHLLLMGLTNQYLLKPWLEIIEQTRTPLSGIVTLPMISEAYVKNIGHDNKCLILVSQQVPSNLRQSVFINGKLILSRLVPIASFYQGDYASDIIRDIESTQRYLFSQRIIDRSEMVTVNILCNSRHYDKLKIKCDASTDFDYRIENINDVLKEQKLELDEEQDFSSALFCYFVTRKFFVNHYARISEKKYFNHYLGALAIKVLSASLLAIGVGLMLTSVARAYFYQSAIDEMQLIEQKYKTKFNQLSESRIDSTASTSTMQDIVQTVRTLEKNFQIRPDPFLAEISQHISLFDSVRVKKLDWFVSKDMDSTSSNELAWDQPAQRGTTRRRGRAAAGVGLYEVAVVDAEFLDFDGNYRFALSAVDDLESAMKVSGSYELVEVLKRPLDIESDNQISGDVSANSRKLIGTAEFSIRVARKIKIDES